MAKTLKVQLQDAKAHINDLEDDLADAQDKIYELENLLLKRALKNDELSEELRKIKILRDAEKTEVSRTKGYRDDLNGQMKINKDLGVLMEKVKKERDSAINDKVTVAKENVILKDKIERLKAMTKAAIDEL